MSIDDAFDDLHKGVRQAAGMLIKRGTAMGPLIPTLLLIPTFLLFAWLFEGSPAIQGALIAGALVVLLAYLIHYGQFAKNDPDRLQSEDFRVEMSRMHLIMGKELPRPVLVDELTLGSPSANPAHELIEASKSDAVDSGPSSAEGSK